LPFQDRVQRLHRIFRWSIVAISVLALGAIWAACPEGRSNLAGVVLRAKWGAERSLGLEPSRQEVDWYWRDRRDRREARTRERFRKEFAALDVRTQALFRAAGMSPEQAVIGWGNYDMTLVKSGAVFSRADSGRQYQHRPGVKSIWLRQLGVMKMHFCMYLFPDTPEVRRLAADAGAEIIPGLSQTTNSWGFRGVEPDRSAPVRGIVLGDSFMQGYMVGDDDTPPEQLRRFLGAEMGVKVSILNTGTLGYCPEHYYYTLVECGERFSPQFIVVGLYSNDFGEDDDVLFGRGDWDEEKYWLRLIIWYCRVRGIRCVVAPVPCELQLRGMRNAGQYPGKVADLMQLAGVMFCDSTDAFIDADLKVRRPSNPGGNRLNGRSHLYNGDLGDGHLSSTGAAVWAQIVARRLALLLENDLTESGETTGAVNSTSAEIPDPRQ
jgi:hypothetical protein